MGPELTEDEILENDVDPIDGINEFRRQEQKDLEENSDDPKDPEEDVSQSEEEENSEPDSDDTDEDSSSDDSESDEDSPKEKAEEEKVHTFKADNQEYTFTEKEMLEQFGEVFGKAVNFTQKTQKLAPYRKMISALEEKNLSEEDFGLALDLLNGDKNALKKLAEDKGINFNDLMFEDKEDNSYTPSSFGKSDFDAKLI